AAKLGFDSVYAVDVDPQAIEATNANAGVNGVTAATWAADPRSDPLPAAEYAVMNVSLEHNCAVAERLGCTRLVASGYLVSASPEDPGFRSGARREAEGWAADLHIRTK